MGQDRDPSLPLKQATAIGYSIVCNLGGDRQMTVQCFVEEDEADEIINTRIDKVFRVLDRKKAQYDLSKLETEFEEVGRHLRNFLNAIPVAEKTAQHQEALLTVRLNEQRLAREEVYQRGYAAHNTAGRRGAFTPTGALKGQLGGMDIEIKKTEDALKALPNDTAQHRSQVAENVRKYQDDLAKRRVAINDLRKLAGLSDYDLFMAEQTTVVEG